MKKPLAILLAIILLGISEPIGSSTLSVEIIREPVAKVKVDTVRKDQLRPFLRALSRKESGGNYQAINQYGYLGKYQFSLETLHFLGFYVTQQEFLSQPELQEEAMIAYLRTNRKILRKEIAEYDGTFIEGRLVTKSGILAAAHLAGAGNVQKYFKSLEDFQDGNGVSLTNYLFELSGYHLNLKY